MPNPLRIDLHALHHPWLHAGNHLQKALERPHLLELLERLEEVLQVELAAAEHLLLEALRRLHIDRLLSPLDEADDIAHLEDPSRHSFRIEDREVLHPLADADELDRHAEHAVDRERRAAARIAVHLGEDDAGQADRFVESLGDPDGFLPGHPVGHQKNLQRRRLRLHRSKLLHQRLIRLQAPGRIEQDVREAIDSPLIHRSASEIGHVFMLGLVNDRHLHGPPERLQLLARCRPVWVAGYQQGPPALPLEPLRQLPGRRRLP